MLAFLVKISMGRVELALARPSQRQRNPHRGIAGSTATPVETPLGAGTPLEQPTRRRRAVVVDTRTRSPSGEPRAGLPSGERLLRPSRPAWVRSEPTELRCPNNSAADSSPCGRASLPA